MGGQNLFVFARTLPHSASASLGNTIFSAIRNGSAFYILGNICDRTALGLDTVLGSYKPARVDPPTSFVGVCIAGFRWLRKTNMEPPDYRQNYFFVLNLFIARSVPSATKHSTASAAVFSNSGNCAFSSPDHSPNT